MNIKNWISDTISNPVRIAIPIMTHPGIEFTGRTVKQAVTDGQIQYESIKALDEKYPSGACTVIMDLTVEAEAFGAEILFPENEVPTVVGRLLHNKEEVDNLQVPEISPRLQEFLKACKMASTEINNKPVFGGAIGPYSLAGRLYDFSEMMIACYCEPETITALLDKVTEFLIKYILEIKKQGVNGVIIAEPAAGLISAEDCHQYSSVYVKKIVEHVQDDSFAVILHNCGNKGHCTQSMLSTCAMGLHFGNAIDMVSALEECPKDVLILGNLDPVRIFKDSTAKEMSEAVTDLLNRTSQFPNFVLSSGCDVPPHIPIENIDAFYNSLAEYNKK